MVRQFVRAKPGPVFGPLRTTPRLTAVNRGARDDQPPDRQRHSGGGEARPGPHRRHPTRLTAVNRAGEWRDAETPVGSKRLATGSDSEGSAMGRRPADAGFVIFGLILLSADCCRHDVSNPLADSSINTRRPYPKSMRSRSRSSHDQPVAISSHLHALHWFEEDVDPRTPIRCPGLQS